MALLVSASEIIITAVLFIVIEPRLNKTQRLLRYLYSLVIGLNADTPQFREGNPYFVNENPYQSVSIIYASIYRENVHPIHIAMQFANKSRHCVIKIDNQQQSTKIGALLHVARQSD